MSSKNYPENYRYSQTHEWARQEADGTITVGITEHAQAALGDLVYVDLPKVGAKIDIGDDVCVVESVKAASDVYSPIAGEIIAINNDLLESPEIINKHPFTNGWLFKLKPYNSQEFNNMLEVKAYLDKISQED